MFHFEAYDSADLISDFLPKIFPRLFNKVPLPLPVRLMILNLRNNLLRHRLLWLLLLIAPPTLLILLGGFTLLNVLKAVDGFHLLLIDLAQVRFS